MLEEKFSHFSAQLPPINQKKTINKTKTSDTYTEIDKEKPNKTTRQPIIWFVFSAHLQNKVMFN